MSTILHIITDLHRGGAEAVLVRMLRADPLHTHHVLSLMDEGIHAPALREAGITVHALNMPRGRVSVRALVQLRRVIRSVRPDVIQTWMYHADLLGAVVARTAGAPPVVWGLHNGSLSPAAAGPATRAVARACALLSGWLPARIVSCSEHGRDLHARHGYDRTRIVVIPNGCDGDMFYRDDAAGAVIREAWGVPAEIVLFGTVARFHPQKDHGNLARALGELKSIASYDWRIVLVGDDMDSKNETLVRWLREAGVLDRVILAGPRDDVRATMNAFDVHVLPSMGESFPMVLLEAMASGTPCVSTSSGDSALIVGDTGWVVPVKDPAALARAMNEAALTLRHSRPEWETRRQAARARILEKFDLKGMVRDYTRVWAEMMATQDRAA